jgi:hypothetical protein
LLSIVFVVVLLVLGYGLGVLLVILCCGGAWCFDCWVRWVIVPLVRCVAVWGLFGLVSFGGADWGKLLCGLFTWFYVHRFYCSIGLIDFMGYSYFVV